VSGVTGLAPQVGILAACVVLAVSRASYFRSLAPRAPTPSAPCTGFARPTNSEVR
jgi:hypothetical protein